ncbi:MAG TPA: SMC family ATPase [Anaerolineae bacterium]|nr:SMC family ATPase [Anaerolineae bacterium]
MIPVELRLTNFMSYTYMDEPLDFSSIHTAVLCGPNGHGKSSLLDAITWALWGQARGVDRRGTGTDDLIHRKEPHMQVEFTFDLEGQRYRVIRARKRKGKTGQSKLEFQVLDGGEPRPLTGETLNITQEIINKTLRMDYETFVNSAFIMQGRADTFMAKSANERKEILSEILGLSIYDELEELAKERRKELNDRLREIDVRVADIDRELAQAQLYEEEFKVASNELGQIQAEIREVEAGIATLRGTKAVLDMKTAQLSEISMRIDRAKSDLLALDDQLKSLEEDSDRAKALVNKEDDINAAYAELTALRRKDEELTETGHTHAQLEARVNDVRLKIVQARSALESDIEHLSRRKAELEKEISRKPAIEARLVRVNARLSEIESDTRRRDDMRNRYSELREKKASLEASIKANKAKLTGEEKRRGLLSASDSCPLCKKPIDMNERSSIDAEINKEIAKLTSSIASESAELDSITSQLPSLEAEGRRLTEGVNDGSALQTEKGGLEMELGALSGKHDNISALSRRLSDMHLKLVQNAFALEEQSELQRLSRDINELGYSAEEHRKVKDRLKELVEYERLAASLESAKQAIKTIGVTIRALADQRDIKLKSIDDDGLKAQELKEELATSGHILTALTQAEEELAGKKRVEATVIDRRSAAQVKLDTCKRLASQKRELDKERRGTATEAGLYDELAFIFSKKGIQALIIENTIPEIEEEANALLRRLTNGQMSLHFVTQKNQKTGGIVETLDLIITDGELGERKYELFSGGEAFRINFAVRIALSKLLARRAGARLETLVIDEGFGTQDEEGKEKLIEAITAVQGDFKKIIVITHLEDLKELFPARIEVTKRRGAGSIATVI